MKSSLNKMRFRIKNIFDYKLGKSNATFINNLYLLGGINFSKQNITTNNYNSNFNYDLADYNSHNFKTGYFAGFRLDFKDKKFQNYSFEVSLNKIVSGTNYEDGQNLNPFLGTYSKFKADDQFLTLSAAAHFRKLLPLRDTSKLRFYIIAGPSIDTRLSKQSLNNLVNTNYYRFIMRGDLGLEFDNQGYYTIFIHYNLPITSFTKTPVNTFLNTLEMGVLLKVSDVF